MFKAVIVGCGLVAGYIDDETPTSMAHLLPRSHAAALRAHPEVELVAACDVNAESLAKFGKRWSVTKLYQDQQQMLRDIKPDLVCVATPATFHAETCENAVKEGARAIYCEKALATSVAEAEALQELIDKHEVAFNLGLSRRFEAGFRMARQLIADGHIGQPSVAVGYSSGPLMRTHSHTFDTLAMLLGDPPVERMSSKVSADQALNTVQDPPVEHAAISYQGGVKGMIIPAAKRYEFEVFGETGSIRSRNSGRDWELYQGNGPRNFETASFPDVDLISPTYEAIDELLKTLAGHRHRPTSAPISIAVDNMKALVTAVESSAQGGCEIRLPITYHKRILSN